MRLLTDTFKDFDVSTQTGNSVPAGVQKPHRGGDPGKELRPWETVGLGGGRVYELKAGNAAFTI